VDEIIIIKLLLQSC